MVDPFSAPTRLLLLGSIAFEVARILFGKRPVEESCGLEKVV